MKKYGKYETVPVSAGQKKAAQKSVMLQTYFTSLLCLVLCVVMFFGTTYAWFTSEVNNVNNEIYIGILDVEMEKALEAGKWASLSEVDVEGNNKTNLFDRNIRWEPGYTTLETIRIVNKGDLAFRYTLAFTDGKFADKTNAALQDDKWKEVAKHFDVWVYDYGANQNVAPTATSYDQIISDGSGWMSAGSLVDVLSGKAVFSGEMKEVRKPAPQETTAAAATETTATEATEPVNPGTTDGIAAEHTYTIALHMKEDADFSAMGHKITMNVKLIAYQMTQEADDFGNQYDKMAATAEELNEALKAGGKVSLATDIHLVDTKIEVPKDVTAVLNLNGHTISQKVTQTTAYAMITNKGNLTITDSVGTGKISYADIGNGGEYASNTIRNEGVLTIAGGRIENTSSAAVADAGYPHAIDVYPGSTTNITGGTVVSEYYDAIRMFCNDTTKATIVNISGGNIINRVSFQNPDNGRNTPGYGVLNITGGEFTTKNGVNANVRLLNFSSDFSNMKATISGGTFDKGVKTQNHSSATTLNMSDWLKITNRTLADSADANGVYAIN